jgi:hypothetical protein
MEWMASTCQNLCSCTTDGFKVVGPASQGTHFPNGGWCTNSEEGFINTHFLIDEAITLFCFEINFSLAGLLEKRLF